MKQVLIVGDSYARGHGLKFEENDPQLWVNQLVKAIGATDVDNKSASGINNEEIFHRTVGALIKKHYDLVIVSWTLVSRFNFKIGLELHDTTAQFRHKPCDIFLHNDRYDKNRLLKIGKELLVMQNDHWNNLKLVQYVNALVDMQSNRGGKIFFVNGLCEFSENYFVRKNITHIDDLSDYEKNLLSVTSRSFDQVIELYNMIHNHYDDFNGIQESHWLNLYKDLHRCRVDTVSDTDEHPGYASQRYYASFLISSLQNKLENV